MNGQDYSRLRFGIGNDFAKGQQVDFVLSNFLQPEFETLPAFMDKASEMIFRFVPQVLNALWLSSINSFNLKIRSKFNFRLKSYSRF